MGDSKFDLLDKNKQWVKQQIELDPDYFDNLSLGQNPEYLWIGCSDSRVPANQITGTKPGDIFVHRNIANMVVHSDMNMLSVLSYAVEVLKVKHVIVCGHYGCGGVKAAMTNHSYNKILNMWLKNIKDVYRLHKTELDTHATEESKFDRLVELNVQEQVLQLSKTSIIQKAWQNEQRPHLHGWVYGLKDGIIKPVFEMEACSEIDPLYKYDDL